MTAFQNEPLADFSDSSQRTRFASTLEQVRRECGWKAPCVIGGQPVVTGRWLPSVNPAHPSHIVGQAALARSEEGDRAIARAPRGPAPRGGGGGGGGGAVWGGGGRPAAPARGGGGRWGGPHAGGDPSGAPAI